MDLKKKKMRVFGENTNFDFLKMEFKIQNFRFFKKNVQDILDVCKFIRTFILSLINELKENGKVINMRG